MNITAPTTGITSRQEFLTVLKASKLLTPKQLEAVEDWSLTEPKKIALRLFKKNLLTRWQAQQILAGQHRVILGRYKLLEKVGEGGMGAVFKAEHQVLKRTVAVKVMNKDVLDFPGAVERFYREVQTVAALDHQNIIRAYDADRLGDIHLLVMEYVEGHDLKTWLNKCGVLPVAWACEAIRQSALGLQHAHETGLIHRDIKPGNILVVADSTGGMPQAKVLDLGLAKFITEKQTTVLTQTGICMGTIDYLAPEQAKDSKSVDIRADIYGLGATLFRLITGDVPYNRGNSLEKLVARTTEDPPFASAQREEVPRALDAVIAKTMRRNPDERFATPGELAEALSPFALATMDQTCRESSSLSLPAAGGFDLGSIEPAGEDQALSTFLASVDQSQKSTQPVYEKTVVSDPNKQADVSKTAINEVPQVSETDRTEIVDRNADGTLAEADTDSPNYLVWSIAGAMGLLLLAFSGWLFSGPSDTPIAEIERVPAQSKFVDPDVQWNKSQTKPPKKPTPTRPVPAPADPATPSLPQASDQLETIKWLMEKKGLTSFIGKVDGRRGVHREPPTSACTVVSLNVSGQYFPLTAEELPRLAVFTDVKDLNLGGQPLTDDVLKQLAPLVELHSLILNKTQLTPAAVETLRQFPKLESLYISSSSVEWMQALKELPALRKLQLYRSVVPDEAIAQIKDFPKLRTLYIQQGRVSDAGLLALQEAKQLRLLQLKGRYPQETLEALAQAMPWCEIHHIEGNPSVYNPGQANEQHAVVQWLMTEKGLEEIGVEQDGETVTVDTLPEPPLRVRVLNLQRWRNSLSEEELLRLAALEDLHELHLSGQPLTDEILEQLLPLDELDWLSVNRTQLTPASVATLKRLPKLRVLRLPGSDDWLKAVSQLPTVEKLYLYHETVSTEGMKSLQDSPHVKQLYFHDTTISEAAFLGLQAVKQLTFVQIMQPDLDREFIKQLASDMPWCTIQDVRPGQKTITYKSRIDRPEPATGVSDEQQLAMLKWLLEEKQLRTVGLEIDGQQVTARSVPAASFKIRLVNLYPGYASRFNADELRRLRVLVDLEAINFAAQPLTDDVLADLTTLVNLRSLSLNATQLTPAAAHTLLEFPNLENVQTTTFESEESFKVIAQLPKLHTFMVTSLKISEPAMAVFKDFPSLTQLHLRKVRTTEAGLFQLKAATQLQQLIISCPYIEADVIKRLAKAMPWCEIQDLQSKPPVIYNQRAGDGS